MPLTSTTILSSLILEKQYREAIRRVLQFPQESSIWILQTTGSSSSDSSPHWSKPAACEFLALPIRSAQHRVPEKQKKEVLERLPLHLACAYLSEESESEQRFQLEQLILRLVLIYPSGCSMEDYDHRLPLHQCIWNNATPETISVLLMADPFSIHRKDSCGRTPAAVNNHCSGVFVNHVKDLLSVGVEFWQDARRKAADRFGTQGYNHNNTWADTQDPNVSRQRQEHNLRPWCIAQDGLVDESAYDSSLTTDLESESTSELGLSNKLDILHWHTSKSALSSSCSSNLQQNILYYPNINQCQIYAHERGNNQEKMSPDEKENNSPAALLEGVLSDMFETNQRLVSAINDLAQVNSNLQNQSLFDCQISPSLGLSQSLHHKIKSGTNISTEPGEDALIQQRILYDIPSSLLLSPQNVASYTHSEPNKQYVPDDTMGHPSMNEIRKLRAQNTALKESVVRLKRSRKKQAEKIYFLKSIVAFSESKDLLVDLSDTESLSTFSMQDSVTTTDFSLMRSYQNDVDGNSIYSDDGYSSTASSFRRRLVSPAITEKMHEIKDREFLITGLPSFRMNAFISRLQGKVTTFGEMGRGDCARVGQSSVPDSVEDICSIAAEIYAAHVREGSWRHAALILQWEPPQAVKEAPPLPRQKHVIKHQQGNPS